MRTALLSLLSFVLVVGIIGCDDDDDDDMDTEAQVIWEDNFDDDVDHWITKEDPGIYGWCGGVSHYDMDEGPVTSSAGMGYATAEFGPCNTFWTDTAGIPASGPGSPFGEYNDEVGYEGGEGFTQEMDIYIDQSWSAPDTSLFTFANSLDLLDSMYPNNFRYLLVPVTKPADNVMVMGNQIDESGWYTFRFIFRDDNGNVAVDFELEYEDEVLMSQAMTTTGLSQESVSSFEVDKTGTGYAWFFEIEPGLELPVDEQKLWRP